MFRNAINQDNYDDESLFAMRKVTDWDIYGVKRFPYRGKRKFTPLLSQSLDGAMFISNDVFGLTIKQFERMYKACLDRRKTQEPWITNLRYPDKSSNEYLEYLQNRTDCNTDHRFWIEMDIREKYLYEHLVVTIGTEIDIRTRQRLFIIKDMIGNTYSTQRTQISSGSLSEGLDLPGSDIDTMFVVHEFDIVQNARNIKHPIVRSTYLMETDVDHPGFTRLRGLIHPSKCSRPQCDICRGTDSGMKQYLITHLFLDGMRKFYPNVTVLHGPCITDPNYTHDYVYCIYSKYLPKNAIQWASRHRRQWPPNFVIDRVINNGCLIVAIGPNGTSDDGRLWRLSFSVQEKLLVHSFNFTQLLCYGLLKLSLKRIVNTNNDVKELLCSYFLKTALFWVSEEQDINIFQLPNLYYCFSLCLNKLISWVNICYCPNYFIPEHNMFLGKINEGNNMILLGVLESIQSGGIAELIMRLFPAENENPSLLSTNTGASSIMLDCLFYRIVHIELQENDISTNFKKLALTNSLSKSESSPFIIGVCKFYHAKISQIIAQLLPPPNTKGTRYSIRTCYHKHLQCSTRTDAVSGWLLYASFYYVTEQFHIVLSLTDFVLSRCSPNMIFKIHEAISCEHRIMYRQNVHSSITLNKRMKMAIIRNVRYCENSSLIPKELQLEVEKDSIDIPPVIMSYCLRFLCYHHLGDIFNRQQSLRDLFSTVKRQYLIQTSKLSDSITILGVCYEISGDKDRAYQCYEEALQVDDTISKTAQIRKSKLLL